ncbi:MAG: glycosyltransferase, partial [Muribaculaceae bacterium]|nr:glycosyltransferase [Muribaculaceae bacterium]
MKDSVVVSSLGYLHFPEDYGLIERKRMDYRNRKRFKAAEYIIALSESIKKDLIRYYGIEDDRIRVEYPDIPSSFLLPHDEETLHQRRARYGISGRYLLQYGELNKINNQKMIVEALSNISPDIKVVLVGCDKANYRKELEKIAKFHGVENRVIFIEEIYDD